MKLLVATRSHGKQREFRAALEAAGYEVVFPDDVGLVEAPEEASLEHAETFEANARRKAEYFAGRSGLPTLADDSGLEVISLGGQPGVRSKRWAGASGTAAEVDAANNAELQRRLAGAPEHRRAARYRCVLAFVARAGAVPVVTEGSCAGTILAEPRGTGGFGYDPYFLSAELGRTFAEAGVAEKERVSHRGRALEAMLPHLRHAVP